MILHQFFRQEVPDLLIHKERGYTIDKHVAKYLSTSYIDAIRFACNNFDRRLGISMKERLGSILQAPSRYFYNEWVVTALLNAILIETVAHKIVVVTKNRRRKQVWQYFFENLLPERQRNQLFIVLRKEIEPDTFKDSTYIIMDDMEPFFKNLPEEVMNQIGLAAPAMFLADISVDLRSDIETLYHMVRLCRQELEFTTPFDFINTFSGRRNWIKLVKFCNWFHYKTRLTDVSKDGKRKAENQRFNRQVIAAACRNRAEEYEDEDDLSEEEILEWPKEYSQPVEYEVAKPSSGGTLFLAEGDTQLMATLELNSQKSSDNIYEADTIMIDDPNDVSHSVYDLDTEPLDERGDGDLMDTDLVETEPMPQLTQMPTLRVSPSIYDLDTEPVNRAATVSIPQPKDPEPFETKSQMPPPTLVDYRQEEEHGSDDETTELIYYSQLIPSLKTGFETEFYPDTVKAVEDEKVAGPSKVISSDSDSHVQCAQDPNASPEPMQISPSSPIPKTSSESTVYQPENTSDELILQKTPSQEPIVISSETDNPAPKPPKRNRSISNLFDSDDDFDNESKLKEENEIKADDPKPDWFKLTPLASSQAVVGGHQNLTKYSTPIARLCGDLHDSESPIDNPLFSPPNENARKRVRGEMIFEVTKNDVFGSVIRAKNDGNYSPFLKHTLEPEESLLKFDVSKLEKIVSMPAKQKCIGGVRQKDDDDDDDDDDEVIPSSQDNKLFRTPVKSANSSASTSCPSRSSSKPKPPEGWLNKYSAGEATRSPNTKSGRKKLETLFNQEGKPRRSRSPEDLFDLE